MTGADDELTLLRDTARRVAAAHPLRSADTDTVTDATRAWTAVTAAGLDGLRQGPPDGEPLATVDQTCAVVEELARGLCPAPVLGGLLGHELLRLAGADEAAVAELVGPANAIAVALDPSLAQLADVAGGFGYDAALATHALFLRDGELSVAGLGTPHPSADASRALRPVAGPARGLGLHVDDAVLLRWRSLALVTLAADALGAMSSVFEAAVAYAKTREQFGKPIGAFQAVQHLCADAFVRIEAIRSAVLFAAWSAAYEPPHEALLAATVAKAYAAATGPHVVQTAIQVFGGIAATWEHPAHLHLRRVLMDRTVLGDETVLRQRLLVLRRAS